MFPKIVTGDQIELRVLEPNDENAARLMQALQKSEKHRSNFLKQFWDYTKQSSVRTQLAARQTRFNDDKGVYYGVFVKGTAQLIGEFSFLKAPHEDSFYHTAWIDKAYNGKGYMQEAILLSEKAFFESGYERIVGYVRPSNKTSEHVLKKLNYYKIGRDVNYLIYQKTRADYLKK